MICKRCFSNMTLIYKSHGSTQEPAEEFWICDGCCNEYEWNEAYGEWWLSDEEDKIEDMEEGSDDHL